jgi:photosystem II stability/assembly factor-like uncharacterized protein
MNIKKIIFIFLMYSFDHCFPQFKTIVEGGGNRFIEDISVVENNIIINCSNHSIIMCNDNCDSTWALNLPGPLAENYYKLFRNDRDTVFVSTNNYSNNSGNLYKSNDGGNSWENIFSITENNFYGLAVIKNKHIAIGSDGGRFFYTNNLFFDWTYNDIIANNFAFIVAGSIGDSTFYLFNDGYLLKTSNLFQSWDYGNFGNYNPNGLHILNKDTLMICATGNNQNNNSMISFSINGGSTWLRKEISNLVYLNDVYFKNKNEGYIVGYKLGGINRGIILTTSDFGQTFTEIITPYNLQFTKIEFLNDSIALLGTNNGQLIQWNTKIPITTSLEKIETNTFVIYPNPATNVLTVENSNTNSLINQIIIQNSIGENVKEFKNTNQISNQINLDISSLPNGLYFIKIIDLKGTENTQKFIILN